MTAEAARERRLLREAAEVCLGTLYHADTPPEMSCNQTRIAAARVEVTYGIEGEREHCGFYRVLVPSIDPEGLDEEAALAAHPATLARETVDAELERLAVERGWDYISVDEVYPA